MLPRSPQAYRPAVAVVALALPFVLSNAAPVEEQSPAGASLDFDKKDGTLYIEWSGPILAGMVDDLRAALGKYATASDRVVLFLDSAGGQVEEGDRIIEVLNEIKQGHQLITVVLHGKLCAGPRQWLLSVTSCEVEPEVPK